MDRETLYRFFSGQVTREEQTRILEWLDELPEHRRELIAERKLFDMTLLLPESTPARRRKTVFTRSSWVRTTLRYAAVTLVLAGGGALYLSHLHRQMLTACNVVSVPAGQRANVLLPDGTKVCMNAQSELKYPTFFAGGNRKVQLTGEAFFDVKHDRKHPFVVETYACDVEVLGTEFNIEARPERQEFTASLVRGRVRVTDREHGRSVTLQPSQQVRYDHDRLVVGRTPEYEHFAWRNGLIAFRNASFLSLIDRFGKYYDARIVMLMKNPPSNLFTGKIRIADGLDHALWVLQRNARFTYRWNETKDVVYIQ